MTRFQHRIAAEALGEGWFALVCGTCGPMCVAHNHESMKAAINEHYKQLTRPRLES